MFITIELRLTYFLSKLRNENMSNEVSHSDLATVFLGLFKSRSHLLLYTFLFACFNFQQ